MLENGTTLNGFNKYFPPWLNDWTIPELRFATRTENGLIEFEPEHDEGGVQQDVRMSTSKRKKEEDEGEQIVRTRRKG